AQHSGGATVFQSEFDVLVVGFRVDRVVQERGLHFVVDALHALVHLPYPAECDQGFGDAWITRVPGGA
ncbi:hypothetical protein RFY41_04565, partial [Acinetobacter soli]|nr:hypothetical protein [Acinetobacter soli]